MFMKKGLRVYNIYFSVVFKGFINKFSFKIIMKVIELIIYLNNNFLLWFYLIYCNIILWRVSMYNIGMLLVFLL